MQRRDLASALIGSTVAVVTSPDATRAATSAGPYYPITVAELATGITPTNYAHASGAMRYGATGDAKTDDSGAFNQLGSLSGQHVLPDGTYVIGRKIQTRVCLTLMGTTLQSTNLQATAFPDYVLEIGALENGPNPNVGSLQRLRFLGGSSVHTGMLHMNKTSHMWRLDALLFQHNVCPALVVDGCWDSNYTNIDIMSCGYVEQPASRGAAVIIKNACNNLYFRGLRIEACASGCLYVDETCSPVHLVSGKIDQEDIVQYQPAVTVNGSQTSNGTLFISHFAFSGIAGQYVIKTAGNLSVDNSYIIGGTGLPAAILDVRTWRHVNGTSVPGASSESYGPEISFLNLGAVYFSRSTSTNRASTFAVIQSKIPLVRSAEQLAIIANGAVTGNSIAISTTLKAPSNGLYNKMYLVHNPTGTQAGVGNPGSRRQIIQSYTTGQMQVKGHWSLTLDNDWSVEYCGGHFTPNLSVAGTILDQGQDLFAVLQTGAKITRPLKYTPASEGKNCGATSIILTAPEFAKDRDASGYYLVDEITGEPFLIVDGFDKRSTLSILYDRRSTIDLSHTYSIVAGYFAGIWRTGAGYEWSFAGKRKFVTNAALIEAGFDSANIPIWGLGQSND